MVSDTVKIPVLFYDRRGSITSALAQMNLLL